MEAAEKYLKRFPDIKDPKRRTYAAMLAALDDAHRARAGQAQGARPDRGRHADLLRQRQRRADDGQRVGQRPASAGSRGRPGRAASASRSWSSGRASCRPGRCTTTRSSSSTSCRPPWPRPGSRSSPSRSSTASTCCRTCRARTTDAPHDALYWRFGGQMAIRMGDWKLVKTTGGKGGSAAARRQPTREGDRRGGRAVQPEGRHRRADRPGGQAPGEGQGAGRSVAEVERRTDRPQVGTADPGEEELIPENYSTWHWQRDERVRCFAVRGSR